MTLKEVRRQVGTGTAVGNGSVVLIKVYVPSETNGTTRIICIIKGVTTGEVGVMFTSSSFTNHSGSTSFNGSGTIGSLLESSINDIQVTGTGGGSDGGGPFVTFNGQGTTNNQDTNWTMIAETSIYTP